jgi:Ser/Thr protein kinase RdoA (MazF antagonist)
MDPVLLLIACNLYNTSPEELIPLSGGHYNAVYQFPLHQTSQVSEIRERLENDKLAILRIGIEDCPVNQTLGMLEWVSFLAQQGAPVTAPLPSIKNHLLESLTHYGTRYTMTAFEKAEGTLAENIPPSEWDEALFHNIGRAAGKLHHLSAGYHPSRPTFNRPHWFEAYEIQKAMDKLAATDSPAREKLASLIHELRQLPTSPTDFGLIHGDLHFANFIIQPGDQVTIIDFDDCVYGWFAMDIVMALFDILVLYNAGSDEESQRFARLFLSSYLSGYRQENDLPMFWQRQIPQFLKLKELCIYATLIGHQDINQSETWVGRFMRDRSTRIAKDLPYVNIEFSSL